MVSNFFFSAVLLKGTPHHSHLHMYCEQSPSETTVYFQLIYYNDTVSSNQQSIYANVQQVKWRGELREKERERERKQRINGVRDEALDRNGSGVGQKCPLVK